MKMDDILRDLPQRSGRAVAHYWNTRVGQRNKQKMTGKVDQGLRSATTGGAQMDGFIDLFMELITDFGIPANYVFKEKSVELPGFFRSTKKWDLIVVREETLLVAIEAKSQVGPSFGNNLNNRAEEAVGSAIDIWTAYREGAYLTSPQPFLGYFFMLEDCMASNRTVKVKEPHFKVFPEFKVASYLRRYEIFCRKLVLERHYTAAAFIASQADEGTQGHFSTPAEDLSIERFVKVLIAHLGGVG
jgi:hypothetical protein